MVTNQEYPVVSEAFSDGAPKPTTTFATDPDQYSESCHCVFLEQVQVVDGVCHRQAISAVYDLVTGDEYRFPCMNQDNRCSIRVEGEDAVIELRTAVDVGSALVRARRTHRVTLMSGRGHVVLADVLTTSDNRVLMALREAVLQHEDYALISMVPTLDR